MMIASSTASAGPVAGDRAAGAEDGLDRAIRRVEDAVMTIRSGDPQPYIDCWADDPDVTLFGAWGPIERGPASVDGGPEREMVIRVTHIYRRFGEEWMLVHRHADFPPADQRRA
jgi:ketosteroid isomerase-like protein